MASTDLNTLNFLVCQIRCELKNIRKCLQGVKEQFKKDFNKIEELVKSFDLDDEEFSSKNNKRISKDIPVLAEEFQHTVKPIGFMKSIHHQKNGTPRQGSISSLSRGIITIRKHVFNNPSHSLEDLKEYSHVWLIYVFHKNKNEASHAKVSPPRLNGTKIGVFASRSPHRPNAIGLTLAHLDLIEGDTIHVSGIDILDGTPVIDIKPYIPYYDMPKNLLNEDVTPPNEQEILVEFKSDTDDIIDCISNNEINFKKTNDNFKIVESEELCHKAEVKKKIPVEDTKDQKIGVMKSIDATIPQWVDFPPVSRLQVVFNPIAEQQIKNFSPEAEIPFRLEYLKSCVELKSAISCALSEDPRSCYRRQICSDRLYYFMVDCANVTAFFVGDEVEVLRVSPLDKENPNFKLV